MLILTFLRQKSQTYLCRSDFFSALENKGFSELIRDEARQGKAFEGLLKRYFG